LPKTEPFEKHFDQYEDWFVQNRYAYQSEIEAVRYHLPADGRGMEIGVGSGLFAEPFGILYGVEPSVTMRKQALKRGVKNVVDGVAEKLPFDNHFFDFALMMTTICFIDDAKQAFREAWRVIKPDGKLIIGFVDKNSSIGKLYKKHKNENVFYRDAIFYSVDQVAGFLNQNHFYGLKYTQTIFRMLDEIKKPEEVKKGYGEGSFVVVSGIKRDLIL
jgi:ubiquinone/menaquinone biosynthesis C-methylase UbiE